MANTLTNTFLRSDPPTYLREHQQIRRIQVIAADSPPPELYRIVAHSISTEIRVIRRQYLPHHQRL